MKNNLTTIFLFFILLNLNKACAQTLGENNALFYLEIKELLVKGSKENISEIFLQGNSNWNRYERKAVCRGNTKFIFENDTLMIQKYQKEKYLFKIKNNEIIDLNNYASKDYTYLITNNDSLNYKIYSCISFNKNNDSSFYSLLTKYDEINRVAEETTIHKDVRNNKKYVTKYQYEGDTIKRIQYFDTENNNLKLTRVEKITTRYNTNGTINTINSIVTYQNAKGNDNEWRHITQFFYDLSKKVSIPIRIEKYDYFENEKDWIEKHILTIKYKTNNK